MNTTTTDKATARQLWALFCITRVDMRDKDISFEAANHAIMALNAGNVPAAEKVLGFSLTGVEPKAKVNYAAIWDEAHKAGDEAAKACTPVPMGVFQPANPLGPPSKADRLVEVVMDGACGFAWIAFHDGRCGFAKWAKSKGLLTQGDKVIWVFDYRQSMARKEAYAIAAANVLNKHGIKCYASSRMD